MEAYDNFKRVGHSKKADAYQVYLRRRTSVLDGARRLGVEKGALPQHGAHQYEGLLLLDALALFRDGEQEKGMRCIHRLQKSSKLYELVDLICPDFAVHHDRRAQRIRRAILNSGNCCNYLSSRDIAPADTDGLRSLRSAMFAPKSLTPRQQLVLGLVRDGLTNKEIASRLLVSPNTVKWHMKALARLLGAGNRCSMIRIGEQRGLLAPRYIAAAADGNKVAVAAG
jgi:DNA-binding CsgD family transcriptional regulator